MTYKELTLKVELMGLTKKQKNVYEYIVDYLAREGISPTQKEILDHFGLKSFGSVHRYLKYLQEANLITLDWNARRGIELTDSTAHSPTSEFCIPLLGQVAAGAPNLSFEQNETVSIPATMFSSSKELFALTVKGDSMVDDGIFEDDIVVIHKQGHANNGQTVVALVDSEATIKVYYKRPKHIELIPKNPFLGPIIVNKEQDFQILGVLCGLVRHY